MNYSISVEYLKRESAFDFVIDYFKRNKISYKIQTVTYGFNDELDQRIIPNFKSYWQRNIFIMKGNRKYPYFEFL